MQFEFRKSGLLTIAHLRFKRLWISVGAMLVMTVVVGSLISAPSSGLILHDKVLHTIAYAGLMGWFAQIFRHDLTRLLLVLGLVALGIGIEFIQGAVPHREFDVLDMVANVSGVVLSWALAYTWVGNILAWMEAGICRAVMRA